MENNNFWYQNTLRTRHFIEKDKLQKYFGILLSIIIDDADIENKKIS